MTRKQKRLLALVAENMAMIIQREHGEGKDYNDLVEAIGEFESEVENTI